MEKKPVRLIANIWETPDGTRLWSRYTHDAVAYKDNNGLIYMNDGGIEYCHLSQDVNFPMTDRCVYSDEPWEIQRQYILRGTFDQEDGTRLWVPLCKLSNGHLENIIKDYHEKNVNLITSFSSCYTDELEYRKKNNINIPEHNYRYEAVQPVNSPNKNVCPRCGSRNTVCHSGMFVDRYECQDCHYDWR